VVAYLFATMSVQMLNHFVVNKQHYGAVSFLRAEPVFPLGITAMLAQGIILVWLFPRVRGNGSSFVEGIRFSLLMGIFLGSYMVFAEPAKYVVPSTASWMAVESIAGFIQFGVFGILLGWIHFRF